MCIACEGRTAQTVSFTFFFLFFVVGGGGDARALSRACENVKCVKGEEGWKRMVAVIFVFVFFFFF